jgi:hypothetical protein
MIDVIGLSGYARTGKDTAAKLLSGFGFKRVAFADTLRAAAYALNPIVGHRPDKGLIHLQDVIDEYGWDGYKATEYAEEIRRVLQRLGTEVGRNLIGQDVWVEATFNNLTSDRYVVTDCRFPNEADYIRERYDGLIIRIERPGVGPINGHPSETALDGYDFDFVVDNNGTPAGLKQKLLVAYAERRDPVVEQIVSAWGWR